MNDRNIAIASNIVWNDSYKIGTHFFAEHFLQHHYSVAFLTQISLLSFLDPKGFGSKFNRLKESLKGCKVEAFENGHSVTSQTILSFIHSRAGTPLLDSYFVSKNYLNFTYPSLRKLSKDWLFNAFIFDCMGIEFFPHIRADLIIYRLNDLVSAASPWISKGLAQLEEEAIRKVDLILAVSKPLLDRAVKKRGNSDGVYLLPNGVDIERFLASYEMPEEYIYIPTPIALYVGNMRQWFDWDLLFYAANAKKDISFVLIGSGNIPASLPDNVHVLGTRPYEQIPAYMKHADIGLIPFTDISHIQHVERPLKFYQYIASGLPIVSVAYGAMKAMAPYAILCESPQEFTDGLEKALTFSKNERSQLIETAKTYSWSKIFEQFDNIMRTSGYSM
ncbi:glycosyltransferase [candidate division KSB1 bacterium]|nr:glycosyltransferase [candidate division KSB1 bacterium]